MNELNERKIAETDNPVFDAIKRSAIYCLALGAPGISESMRLQLAINIARRAVHHMRPVP
jgi:hypothetical protein